MSGSGASDVVFTFSYETYADAVSRGMMRPPDRILQTLLASDRVDRLLVANPFRSVPGLLARQLRGRQPELRETTKRRLVTPPRLRRADPTGLSDIIRTYRRYDSVLRQAATELGMTAPAVITTNPLVAAFSPFGWASAVTYFARDDWLSYSGRQEYWPAYAVAYRHIRESEVGVLAVSQQIIDRIAPRGPHAVVPNGVEPSEWLGVTPAPPDWLTRIPNPRAIYVGTIDDRLDVEGVAALATRRPGLQIILLGPAPDPDYTDRLRRHANVHIHPGVGRAELVAALRNCDVALLAHRRTALTEAMSPLKVYEYLAAGLPVVAIDLPPVRDIDARVIIAPSTAGMGEGVDQALAVGMAMEDERVAFVHANSWTARHETVLQMTLRPSLLRRGEELPQLV